MIKQKDITADIMRKVIKFEKKRSKRYLAVLAIMFVAGTLVFVAGLYFVARELFQEEISGLLSMFFGDWDLLSLVWQDALAFVWDVIPHYAVYTGGIAVLAIIVLFIATRHRRRITARRLREIKQL